MKLSEMLIRLRSKIPQEGKLLLAFSGGEDSLFLMYLLSLYFSDRAEALYVNHNLRGEEELKKEIERNKHKKSCLCMINASRIFYAYFFLMSVKPSRSGRMTTSTLGSLAIR